MERWEVSSAFDGKIYDIRHKPTGCEVWVANSWYGVSILMPDKVQFPQERVTEFSSMFGRLTWRNKFVKFAKLFKSNPDVSAAKVLSGLNSMTKLERGEA